MKRLILSFFLYCIAACSFAQEHLSFKGIPIEGGMTDFCQKLKAKGFSPIAPDGNITVFTGDFIDRTATVIINATDDCKNVYSVVVIFDPIKGWDALVNTYDYYKSLYIRKYGKPTKSNEYKPNPCEGNNALMYRLNQGIIKYSSSWNVLGGTIEISIEKGKNREGLIVIKYIDTQNTKVKIQKELEDI